MVTGDFNGDHKPDLAILCGQGSTQVPVLLGDGKGGFKPSTAITAPSRIFGNLLATDVNGDGKTDLIFGQQGPMAGAPLCGFAGGGFVSGPSVTVATLLSKGDGTFSAPILTDTLAFYGVTAAADLNGDGIPDLGLADLSIGIAFMLGHKDGTFSTLTPITETASCFTAIRAIADFTNDRKSDILALRSFTAPISTALLVNQGDGVFAPKSIFDASVRDIVLVADVDGDGLLDLLLQRVGSDPTSRVNAVVLGTANGTFGPPIATVPLFQSLMLGLDLNGDGKADMVQSANQNGLIFYLSNGDGTFKQLPVLTAFAGFSPAVVADFNGDGRPDLAGFLTGTTDMEVLINTASLVTGAVNGAAFAKGQPLSPGSLVSLFGNGFASSDTLASTIPLPFTLGGVSVTVGGIPAALQFVNSQQINLQVPWEITSNSADIVVTANGNLLPVFRANIAPVAPGIFTLQSGLGQAIAINPDGSLAGPQDSFPGLAVRPAKVGDPLVILATGLGAVSPTVADGADSLDALRSTAATPVVLIGGMPATVSFSGLSPQFVGVNQINVIVPDIPAGVVTLQIKAGGITTSDQVTISVSQ